jgi:hypothetical protein
MKELLNRIFGFYKNDNCISEEPWYIGFFQNSLHLNEESRIFLEKFNNHVEFGDYRDLLISSSVAFGHFIINEPCPCPRYLEVMASCSKGKSLEEVSALYPSAFPRYFAKKRREELLAIGKEDFINHISLLKKQDPELARQKVLEIIKELL